MIYKNDRNQRLREGRNPGEVPSRTYCKNNEAGLKAPSLLLRGVSWCDEYAAANAYRAACSASGTLTERVIK